MYEICHRRQDQKWRSQLEAITAIYLTEDDDGDDGDDDLDLSEKR